MSSAGHEVETLRYHGRSLRTWWADTLTGEGSRVIYFLYADYHLARRLASVH